MNNLTEIEELIKVISKFRNMAYGSSFNESSFDVVPFAKDMNDEKIVIKICPDGFFNTDLDSHLKAKDIKQLLIAGEASLQLDFVA